MRRVILSLSVLGLALAAPLAAGGQELDRAVPIAAEAPVPEAAQTGGAAAVQPEYAGLSQGLPARVAPPRTMRAYWHVFVAFAVTWLLLFGYALSLGRRFGQLDDEVRRLSRASE